ncbi:PD-(D/E)XK nuclease family protein [Kitasatospora sp. NPDC088556]|uniref:PD-(D/E)XK nuclease family protein n=1 Tax=Kitasatospora sp. NPDC088556 TaxID=3364076 RepID=UPI0038124587
MSIATQPRSVSQALLYEGCGERYRLGRVEREVPLPAAWSMHGTAFHSAAEAIERSGRRLGEEEAVQLFSDEYARLINKALEQEPDTNRWLSASGAGGEDIEHRYVLGQEQTRQYWAWAQEQQPAIWSTDAGEPGLELGFEVELGGVWVRGFIDQLLKEADGTVRVRDLKTGSTKARFQLETYAVAVQLVHEVKVLRGDWYFAKKGGLSRPVDLSGVTVERVGERFAAMDQGVKAGRFEPKPGFLCRFCDLKHKCFFFDKNLSRGRNGVSF